MLKNKTKNREKIVVATLIFLVLLLGLMGRLVYFMVFQSQYYSQMANDLHVRERYVKAKRGKILDRNGVVLADNITVCNVSVIHNQIQDKEAVIEVLCKELGLSKEYVEKREVPEELIQIQSGSNSAAGNPGVCDDTDTAGYYFLHQLICHGRSGVLFLLADRRRYLL